MLATLTYRAGQGLICCKARDRQARRADSVQTLLTEASATVERIPDYLRHERKVSRWEGAGLVSGALVGLRLGGPLGAVIGGGVGVIAPRVFQKKKHRYRPD